MQLADVIKWESSPTELVHKFRSDGVRLGSQLIVYPSQTAFFVKGGTICDEFLSGTYTIKSDNIPLVGKFLDIPFGGETPFKAEVWFVNQVELLDCKWGTSSPLQIDDPTYGVIVPIRAYGQYGFKILQPRLFLERLVGNMSSFATAMVTDYFRSVIITKLTSIIYDKLRDSNISVLNINAKVEELSEYAKERIKGDFEAYGIEISQFNIASISVKEDDASFKRLKEAKDAAAKMKIISREDYKLMRSFDVLENAAQNTGGTMSAAMGLGAGVGMGSIMGQMTANVMTTDDTGEIPPIPRVDYYIAIGGNRQGPLSLAEIEQKFSNGEVNENTLAWKKGLKQWVKMAEMEDFKQMFEECPPPLPVE